MHSFTDTKEEQRLKALQEYNIIEIETDFSYILESLLLYAMCPLVQL